MDIELNVKKSSGLRRLRVLAVAAVSAVSVLGCASGSGLARMKGESTNDRYVQYAGAPIDKFTNFNINGWTPISRDQLVVWNGVNEAYLIKVWDNCQDLQFAQRIGITSTTNQVSKFEKVLVGRDQCPISEIRPIDVKQMKADRKAQALADKPGAGVEPPKQ